MLQIRYFPLVQLFNRLIYRFFLFPQYLLKDLVEGGLWTSSVRNQIIADKGSIQNVGAIPQDIKDLYKVLFLPPSYMNNRLIEFWNILNELDCMGNQTESNNRYGC